MQCALWNSLFLFYALVGGVNRIIEGCTWWEIMKTVIVAIPLQCTIDSTPTLPFVCMEGVADSSKSSGTNIAESCPGNNWRNIKAFLHSYPLFIMCCKNTRESRSIQTYKCSFPSSISPLLTWRRLCCHSERNYRCLIFFFFSNWWEKGFADGMSTNISLANMATMTACR